MRRVVFGLLDVVVMVTILTAGAAAAPETASSADAGPYQGAFYGRVLADHDSSAPILLALVHQGHRVGGTVYLAEGLTVDGGVCGTVDVPATLQEVEGTTSPGDSNHLIASPTFELSGLQVGVDLESTVSVDGQLIEAKATIDLPWICGRDPVLTASLQPYWVGSP
ncbi:MAG: hypothetical protein PVH11_02345 [Anaerolineae bacterium]